MYLQFSSNRRRLSSLPNSKPMLVSLEMRSALRIEFFPAFIFLYSFRWSSTQRDKRDAGAVGTLVCPLSWANCLSFSNMSSQSSSDALAMAAWRFRPRSSIFSTSSSVIKVVDGRCSNFFTSHLTMLIHSPRSPYSSFILFEVATSVWPNSSCK
jgi:hypothetical protein